MLGYWVCFKNRDKKYLLYLQIILKQTQLFMKKFLILIFLLPTMVFSQKVKKGGWIGSKPSIEEVTIINRGKDPLGFGDLLVYELSMKGVKSFSQTNFSINTTINSESVNTKYAVTFTYVYNGVGTFYSCNITVIDVEQDGNLIGQFILAPRGKGKNKVAEFVADLIVN